MTARRDGEDFADYQARRKVENSAHMRVRIVAGHKVMPTQHTANGNRQKKRALVKAMGARQFKIQSRKSE